MARNWAESTSPPDGVGTKSAKTLAGESESYRDKAKEKALKVQKHGQQHLKIGRNVLVLQVEE